MKTLDVTVVRIYITESSNLLNEILKHLKEEVKIRGVSVFRAISGYGEGGSLTVSLLDLSLDLPLVIEFFDPDTDKIEKAFSYLNTLVKSEHIVWWPAKTNVISDA